MPNNNNLPKNGSNNKWLSLINIPFQMGIIIFLFYKAGEWLDVNYTSTTLYYNQLFTLLGVAVALYNVIKQVNILQNK